MSNKIKTIRTDLICPQCYNITTIQRVKVRKKSNLHKKKLYCYICKEEVNQIEVNDIDFLLKKLEFLDQRTSKQEQMYYLVKRAKRRK